MPATTIRLPMGSNESGSASDEVASRVPGSDVGQPLGGPLLGVSVMVGQPLGGPVMAGQPPGGRVLERTFYARDPLEVAPELLGKVLTTADGMSGRIVEVEAYRGSEDAASHAYRGRTRRNATMFGPPGHLYVYFAYGMHYCANAVCQEDGVAGAVLLRALAPIAGLAAMVEGRHSAGRSRGVFSGPARLCRALGIDRGMDGADLASPAGVVLILDDGREPPASPVRTTRVGLGVRSAGASSYPWRFLVPDDPHVSRPA